MVKHKKASKYHDRYCIFAPSAVTCSHQPSPLYWIVHWYLKFHLQSSTTSFLFKNYSLANIIYLLIIFNKTTLFPWNTKNTSWCNSTKHTPHTQRKIRLGRVNWCPNFFKKAYFTNPSLFMGKIWFPTLCKYFGNSTLTSFTKWEIQLCPSLWKRPL